MSQPEEIRPDSETSRGVDQSLIGSDYALVLVESRRDDQGNWSLATRSALPPWGTLGMLKAAVVDLEWQVAPVYDQEFAEDQDD